MKPLYTIKWPDRKFPMQNINPERGKDEKFQSYKLRLKQFNYAIRRYLREGMKPEKVKIKPKKK